MARCDVRAVFLPALAGAAFWMLSTRGIAAEAPTAVHKPPPTAADDPFGAGDAPSDPFGAPNRPADAPTAPQADAPRPAPQPSAPPKPAAVPGPKPLYRHTREAIEKALDSPTEMEFIETPLSDVVDYLKDYHGIEIQFDQRPLERSGWIPSEAVMMSLRGVSLRTALNLMLRRLNLAWTIENEVLLITTPEELESRRTTEVYDVTDLVACRDENDRAWHDLDPLVSAARGAAGGPRATASEAVTGATFGNTAVLVVTESQPGHERVAALLAKIRKLVAERGPKGEAPRRNRPEPKNPPEPAGENASAGGGKGGGFF